MRTEIPAAAFWALAAVTLVVVVLLVRQRLTASRLRTRNATLEDRLRARDEEVRHLAAVRLPALADAPHQPVLVPGLLDKRLDGTAFAQSLQAVMDLFAGTVERAQARADQSAKAALKASMRALQGLANEQQLSITEMQERHDNPDVLRDLLEIDHANSQFGRRAQAIAVLCGSWPGRQRAASSLSDVVRGAKSRIRDYRRVQVRTQVDLAVVSRAVEPVVLAVAELLDNAARHSQPNTTVEVNLQPAHNGACIVIDDAGVGMEGPDVERATRLLTGRQTLDVTRLGDPPQFGFPVIGVLAARYGFTVSVDTRSPYGGVRAVVFLPSTLLTQLEPEEKAAPAAVGPRRAQQPREPFEDPDATAWEAPGDERDLLGVPGSTPAAPRGLVPPAPAPAPAAHERPRGHDWPPPASTAVPAAHGDAPAGPEHSSSAQIVGSTPGGLPKRRRRQPAATRPETVVPTAPPAAPAPSRERSAEEIAQRMGAFARGTRSGRTASEDHEGNTR